MPGCGDHLQREAEHAKIHNPDPDRAIGGNAATATSVDVESTNGTPVLAFKMAVGGLTQNAIARMGLATHSTNTGIGTALGHGDGLQITATGTLATATHIDYCVFYTVTPS